MTENLGAILDGLDKCRQQVAQPSRIKDEGPPKVAEVVAALQSLSEIVRYLNTRRSRGAVLDLDDEAAIQDVLYLMLRPWVLDLTPENPTDRFAGFIVQPRSCILLRMVLCEPWK